MRMFRVAPLLLLVPFFALGPTEDAEAQVMFGPQVMFWDFEEIGIGARVDVGLGETFGIEEGFFEELFASINANYMLGDLNPIVVNANVAVPFTTEAGIRPFAGAGINHTRWSAGDDVFSVSFSASGLNLLGGLFFDLGDIPAFADLQYSTTGAGFLQLGAGVLFGG